MGAAPPAARRAGGVPRDRASGRGHAAGDRRARRRARRRPCCSSTRPAPPTRVQTKSTPDRPRKRGRRGGRARDPRRAAARAPRRRHPRRGGARRRRGETGLRWVVDPLDGTVNYLFDIPQWCVSVACEGRAGVILDPVRGECFRVIAGRGGDARRRAASSRARARTSDGARGDRLRLRRRGARARRPRRSPSCCRGCATSAALGSAALDLAWTAAGRFDAYFERGVQPWDVAAGLMLCHTAGLQIRPLDRPRRSPDGVLVAPSGLVDELLDARRLSPGSSRFWGMLHTATGWWIEEAGAPAPLPPLTAPARGRRRRDRRRVPRHVDRVAPARARPGHPASCCSSASAAATAPAGATAAS